MESLKGKYVLVTGATGGIGAKLVKMLLASGAQVFATGRSAIKLQAIATDCKLPQNQVFAADLTNELAIQQLHDAYFAQFPTIDILVNASGIGIIKSMETLSLDEFNKTLSINLVAPFLLAKAFLPTMKHIKKG